MTQVSNTRSKVENYALLRYSAASSGISYRRLGITYQSHGSRIQFLTPEDGANKLFRNVGKRYHHSLCNISEEPSSQLLRGGNLKPRTSRVVSETDCS